MQTTSDSTDTNSRPEGYTALSLPSTTSKPFPFPFPSPFSYPPTTSPLLSTAMSTAPASSEYLYEDVVELHETVHSLRTRLTAASSDLSEWKQKAATSESLLQATSEELSTLRLMCGNEEEVTRWRAGQQRRAREEMREWRRQQEEQVARLVVEREKAAIEHRKDDEQREIQMTAELTRQLRNSLTMARELQSLWRTAVGDSSVLDHRALPPSAFSLQLASALQSDLSALHQAVLDHRARQMLEQTNGQCVVQ